MPLSVSCLSDAKRRKKMQKYLIWIRSGYKDDAFLILISNILASLYRYSMYTAGFRVEIMDFAGRKLCFGLERACFRLRCWMGSRVFIVSSLAEIGREEATKCSRMGKLATEGRVETDRLDPLGRRSLLDRFDFWRVRWGRNGRASATLDLSNNFCRTFCGGKLGCYNRRCFRIPKQPTDRSRIISEVETNRAQ